MKKILVLTIFTFICLSCSNNKSKIEEKTVTKIDTVINNTNSLKTEDEIEHSGFEHENPLDTFKNGNKDYILRVFKHDTICYFTVSKKIGQDFKVILKDPEYGTNNSSLFVEDANNDGYLDIVWTKKWQDHAYLFNPKIENFIEVGEFHGIDTLKVEGQIIYYNALYPLLYYTNEEKDLGTILEQHSELFVIDSNYRKISFATLDNFASLEDWNRERCETKHREVINCYVPPYKGKFGPNSIWNIGKSIDSFEVKSKKFDVDFINNYWEKNYVKVLPYGKIFKVRRDVKLEYH